MKEFMLFSLLCAIAGLSSTFSYSSSAVFSNGTWSLVRTNTSSSWLGNQHALAVLLNHTSTHENNGNHYGNIHNGLNGNGNGVNHNQHDNGNAIQALCRKVCVRIFVPPVCVEMDIKWQILLVLGALVIIDHVVSEEHHRRHEEYHVTISSKGTGTTKNHGEYGKDHHEDHEFHEDHDSDEDKKESFRKLCERLCSGENSNCPHKCAQAYLDPWVGRRRR